MYKIRIIIMALVVSAFLNGCSSSNDEVLVEEKPTLENTVWFENRGGITVTLTFYKTDALMVFESIILGERVSSSYKYAFANSVVTMFPNDSGNAMLEGDIIGNRLTLVNTSTNNIVATLTKKDNE